MGLLDLFRRKNNKREEHNITQYGMKMPHGSNITIFQIEESDKGVLKRVEQPVAMIKARIIEDISGKRVNFDKADYITFEVPRTQKITKQILETVICDYYQEKRNIKAQEYNYMGRVLENKQGYYLGQKDNYVANYTSKQLNSEIIEKQQQNNRQKENNFKEKLNAVAYIDNTYQIKEQQIRNQRKQEPNIEVLPENCEGKKKYSNYNATNINTGDIIKIRKLDKIGKDGSGTYLYSAYLQNTLNRDDVEILDSSKNPRGSFVCFESRKRLEDIIKENNKEEINKLLELFSDVKYYSKGEEVSYIGGIDENNNIQRNNTSSSPAIKIAIENLKREHSKGMER